MTCQFRQKMTIRREAWTINVACLLFEQLSGVDIHDENINVV